MFGWLRRLFPARDWYREGWDTADKVMESAVDPEDTAKELYIMSDGAFNFKKRHYEFDRGIQARLAELGYFDND